MARTIGDVVIHRLYEWGVRHIYGYLGGGIDGWMGALWRARAQVRLIATRHEEMAASMAHARAQLTGEVAVCMASAGPGAICLLEGLHAARVNRQPVVVLLGQQARTSLASDYQHGVDLMARLDDVVHHFVHVCGHPAQAHKLVDRAVRLAMGERDVACILIPQEIQEEEDAEWLPDAGRTHSVPGVPSVQLGAR
jgi:pyruvate dehydrogenase (quinone)